jgi:triphosphatase
LGIGPTAAARVPASERSNPVEAYEIVLARTASTGEAFSAIGLSCLNHFAANENAVRAGEPEGVHQMRVGLRRLRATISVFKEIVQGADTEKIKTELKWLSAKLAPARDFDVLVQKGVAPLRRENPEQRREIALLGGRPGGKAQCRLRAGEGGRGQRALPQDRLRTALWLINGEWSRNADPLVATRRQRSVGAFAQQVLRSRAKRIAKKVGKLDRLDVQERHRLRIAVKKLRYATDFFASLSKAKAKKVRNRFVKELKALQDALGRLNDIAVHEKLARQFARPTKRSKKLPQKAFAIGLLTGREKRDARACIVAAMKAGENLSGARSLLR